MKYESGKRNGGARIIKMLLAAINPFHEWVIGAIDYVNRFDKYPIGVYYEPVKIPHRGMHV